MKTAVIECVACRRAVVVRVATPVVALTVAGAPRLLDPSLNCTVPAAAGATVAVKVTEVPAVVGLTGLTVRVVVVAVAPATGFTT